MLVASENRKPEHASPRAGAARKGALHHSGERRELRTAQLFLLAHNTARERGGAREHPGGVKAQRQETVVEALHTIVPACQKDERWKNGSRDDNWTRWLAQ